MLSPCKTARQFPTLGLNNLSLPSLFSGAGLISWPEGEGVLKGEAFLYCVCHLKALSSSAVSSPQYFFICFP